MLTTVSFTDSWLLHDPDMEPRSMYSPYIEATEQYFKKLLPMLVPLQVCMKIFLNPNFTILLLYHC